MENQPVDAGIIRCTCTSTEDDGFTIQCEHCLVWQHAFCVNIAHNNIPEEYLCDRCQKRKRPKLSKRIPISKKKLRRLDSVEQQKDFSKKKIKKSRLVSRYAISLFKEARERWSHHAKWKHYFDESTTAPILFDHGPFVVMDSTTLFTKGVLMDAPVSKEGLFAPQSIPSLRYLMEMTGDVMLKSEFKFDPINDFVILGTPLSHIMFYPNLDLCIDTRQFGNKARYIRRSCHPNAELRNVVLPQSRDDKTVHLGLFARHLIEKGQEVTINWNWQRGHIAWKENMNWNSQHKSKQSDGSQLNHVIDEEEERRRKSTIKQMLERFEKEFGNCACVNKKRCLIEQLKRFCESLKEKKGHSHEKRQSVNVNMKRKSSSPVILLKPKKHTENTRETTGRLNKRSKGEESLDVDVMSNSPTQTKESDDELLDVEGGIDIADDLPPAPVALLSKEGKNNSSDENGDTLSLSSLSSLSVFDESRSDEDENELARKLKKKKSSSFINRQENNKLDIVDNKVTTADKIPPMLPRKKVWVRDHLSKHIPDNTDRLSDGGQYPIEIIQHRDLMKRITNDNIIYDQPSANDITTAAEALIALYSPPTTESSQQINSSLSVDTTTFGPHQQDITFSELSLQDIGCNSPTVTPPEIPKQAQTNSPPFAKHTDPIITETLNKTDIVMSEVGVKSELDSIDEGELSDASTILLEDDLHHVHNKNPATTETLPTAIAINKISLQDYLSKQTQKQ